MLLFPNEKHLTYLEDSPELEGTFVDYKIVVSGPWIFFDGLLFLHVVVVIVVVVLFLGHIHVFHSSSLPSPLVIELLEDSFVCAAENFKKCSHVQS